MIFLHEDAAGNILLDIYVQPKSSANQVCGIHGDYLKIKLTAPPVDDKANDMLIIFLARLFKVPRNCLKIARGKQSRRKRVIISGAKLDYKKLAAVVHKSL